MVAVLVEPVSETLGRGESLGAVRTSGSGLGIELGLVLGGVLKSPDFLFEGGDLAALLVDRGLVLVVLSEDVLLLLVTETVERGVSKPDTANKGAGTEDELEAAGSADAKGRADGGHVCFALLARK